MSQVQTTKPERPVILGPEHIKRAVADDNFYSMLPEFLTIRRKLDAMHVNLKKGCSSCQMRRVAGTVNSDFVAILNRLTSDGMKRLKRYVGASRLLIRATNRTTGRMELREV